MPELPDITVYLECLRPRIEGQVLQQIDLASPFLLRSVDPPPTEFVGQPIRGLRRLGKRIVWCFDGERFPILHLMIAGRLLKDDWPRTLEELEEQRGPGH